jgi:hypothetical protein
MTTLSSRIASNTLEGLSFFISFGTLLGITLLTVSYQAIQTSLANPMKSLRSE